MAEALVTDVQNRGPLAGVRGLGRAGISVMAVGRTSRSAGLWSRYATERAVTPWAGDDPDGFVRRVVELTAGASQTVIYPGDEESIDPLLEHAGALSPGVLLPYPEAHVVRLVRDKVGLPELVRGAGLNVPSTLVRTTAVELAGASVNAPYILKPQRSGTALRSALLIHDTAHRDAVLSGLPADEPLFIQERASGHLMALTLVISRDGEVAARFQQRTERTWPVEAGMSALAVSVPPDEALVSRAAQALTSAGYWGLVNLQFIATPAGPVLIDLNPRFYGSMPLALSCGVNVAALWHAVATGQSVPRPADYPVGVRFRWLEGDLLAALRRRRISALKPARRPRVGSVWAADDPGPAAVLTMQALIARSGRRGRGRPRA
jgi:predicted ATP-grasp superfamily ATP-dependent carboligase